MTTLADAQAAFRRSPGRATALAYMDAAIEESERTYSNLHAANTLELCCKEIRDWLMNEPDRATKLYDPGFRTMIT